MPRSRFAHLWALDPDVAYLNHGSFGACPRSVLRHQAALRMRLEREPADFLVRELPARLGAAREELARFVNADPAGLAFVPNATSGVNAVLGSLRLAPGDELLTTDHAYGACRRAMEHVAARSGARVVVAKVPFPIASEDEVVAPLLAAVTPRTRLALVDHVTSPTALVFPVERLVAELQALGVDVLVDGAHALGMLPLDLTRLGAAYYTANAHKWLCAPKGAAFLHVREDRRRGLHPTVISHAYASDAEEPRFLAEFDWTGTIDPTPWLSIPEAIRAVGSLAPGGWSEVMERNHALALKARELLLDALGISAPAPDGMIGAMASVPLPAPAPGSPAERVSHEELMTWFRARRVETWLFPWGAPGGKLIRVSAQLYNDEAEFVRLAGMAREALGLSSLASGLLTA